MKQALKRGLLYDVLTKHRARQARAWLKYANLFPEAVDAITEDYHYSIRRDYRGVMQVINIEECVRHVIAAKIPGAFVETGVYTGGASAYALRSMLRNEAGGLRPYWGFDSFEGMPAPTEADGQRAKQWMATDCADGALRPSRTNCSDFDRTFAYLGETGYPVDKINLVKGWFQLSIAANREAIGPIAILRLDGDFYESTKVVLEGLYDNVSEKGLIIVDDYGSFECCRRAVEEFFLARHLTPFLHYVENGIRFFVKP